MTRVRHGYDTPNNSKNTKPSHHRERERERERGNEGSEDVDPHDGNVGTEAIVKGQGVFGGGFGHYNACVPACTQERGRPRKK